MNNKDHLVGQLTTIKLACDSTDKALVCYVEKFSCYVKKLQPPFETEKMRKSKGIVLMRCCTNQEENTEHKERNAKKLQK